MGGENDRGEIHRSAEVGNPPDAFFEDTLPVIALVKFTPDANGIDNKAIFGGEGGIEIGEGWDRGMDSRLRGNDGGRPAFVRNYGEAKGGGEGFGAFGGEAVVDVRPDGDDDE